MLVSSLDALYIRLIPREDLAPFLGIDTDPIQQYLEICSLASIDPRSVNCDVKSLLPSLKKASHIPSGQTSLCLFKETHVPDQLHFE